MPAQRWGLVLLACIANCVHGDQPNSNCEWPQKIGARDLTSDAESAEDLAIRYADACCGPHSGHFENMTEYARNRDACMSSLFHGIATSRGITEEQVRHAVTRRGASLDLMVV